MHTQNWVIEFRTNRSHLYRIVQTEVSTTSKYQEILIADVQGFGRALFLDGVPQSSSIDEHMYHEALIHPALVAHQHPTKVWIAGGGEGAVLREIVKHKTIERVVMVDIDQTVVDLAKTHLGAWHQ
jgi:spermidine synthase